MVTLGLEMLSKLEGSKLYKNGNISSWGSNSKNRRREFLRIIALYVLGKN